jgi:dipeptidyl aminopeptidase/acylaminoacyl peptidase
MQRKVKIILIVAITLLLVLGAGFLGFEGYVYNQFTQVDPSANINLANRPEDFKLNGYAAFPDFDTSPYEMPDYETVQVPSRSAGIMLAGYYVPGDPAAPAVIVVHGLAGCTCEPNILVPAGMLHNNGFNVLLIDLHNHGQSTITNGHAAFGSTEYLDVLGAWDWLIAEKGFAPERIGLFGASMGAATALIALAQEPQVAAAFVDAPFYTVEELLADNLALKGYPRWLAPGALRLGRFISGDNLYAHTPAEGFWQDNGRPLYVVHGTADQRIARYHQQEYAALAEESGANATLWVVEGAGHVQSAFLVSAEYEQRLTVFFGAALK